jgi:hypothetical protein
MVANYRFFLISNYTISNPNSVSLQNLQIMSTQNSGNKRGGSSKPSGDRKNFFNT